jgi:hypothetical protein
MTEFLVELESGAFGTWVRESPSMFAYTGLLSLHALGLAFAVGFSWFIALRILGFARGLPLAAVEGLFPLLWIGFWINAASGIALLISNASRGLTNPVFLTKIALIALAAFSMVVLKRAVFGSASAVQAEVASQNSRVLAGASAAFWAGAIVAGRLSEYPTLFGLHTR